ncbi:MAG: redoxin domain-containing protein [Pseudomonadota bacterium]
MNTNILPPAKKPLKVRLLRWGIDLALIVAVFLLIRAWQAPALPEAGLPPISGVTLDEQVFDSRQLSNHALVVHVWAEWCPVCRMELGGMTNLARDTPLISIAWKSGDDQAVRHFLRQEGLSLPVLNDPQGKLLAPLRIKAVPLHLVVDGQGRIHFVETGYTTEWGLRARVWWVEHFAGS